jgi:hypothetical protein
LQNFCWFTAINTVFKIIFPLNWYFHYSNNFRRAQQFQMPRPLHSWYDCTLASILLKKITKNRVMKTSLLTRKLSKETHFFTLINKLFIIYNNNLQILYNYYSLLKKQSYFNIITIISKYLHIIIIHWSISVIRIQFVIII